MSSTRSSSSTELVFNRDLTDNEEESDINKVHIENVRLRHEIFLLNQRVEELETSNKKFMKHISFLLNLLEEKIYLFKK